MSAVPTDRMSGAASEPRALEHTEELPPIVELAVTALVLIVITGIYMASKLTGHVALALPAVLVGAAAALMLVDTLLLSRLRPFAFGRFFGVFRWALLAYALIAGMLEYVFLYDGVSGGTLAVLSCALVLFALDVPLMIAFTVARYAEPGE